ncbi:myelin-associated glycoprotein-like isoform X2 [Electrophorus electricus]|uniref:myelin-associated glycoprotein-like isoform X2 n=1 Tax=Electrophorus electricus TaxID=8005 RepID=UPI0015CFBEF9|nr:myelin-associated glycoprotein-like isoform X2 [Electrophorus electricus]
MVMGYRPVNLCFLLQVLWCAMVEAQDWHVDMPTKTNALSGSCVVIPCSFTHPSSHNPSVIIWYSYHSTKYPVVYSTDAEAVIKPFRGRTELIGDVKSGNCSLKINYVVPDMNGYQLYPWINPDTVSHKFYWKTVMLNVQEVPSTVDLFVEGEPKEGDTLRIICAVKHTCPFFPPTLSFGDTNGNVQNEQTALGQGYWQTISTISFPAQVSDQGRVVGCWVSHMRRPTVPKWMEINLSYAPRTVHVSGENSMAQAGGKMTLECRSNASPPASSFLWYLQREGPVLGLTTREKSITITDLPPDQSRFYCTAQNTHGVANSTSPFIVTAEYPPSIQPESCCMIHPPALRCWCKVQSRPSASVEWRVDGGEPHSVLTDVMAVSVRQNHTFSGKIRFNGTFRITNVTCRAFNAHGQQEHTLVMKELPLDVAIIQQPTNILEGQYITLSCVVSRAFPAVLSYSWYQLRGDRDVLLSEQSERLHLLAAGRLMGPYRCSALNEVGQSSSASTLIHVDFTPVISPESFCALKNGEVKCECLVDSYPAAAMDWVAAGVQAKQTVTTESHGSMKSTLTGRLGSAGDRAIFCYAANEHGRRHLQLTLTDSSASNGSSIAAAVCGAVILVLGTVTALYFIQRKRRDRGNKYDTPVEVELEDTQLFRTNWF